MKRICMLFCVIGMAIQSKGQSDFDNLVSFTWDSNVPLSNKEFIGNTSSRGFQVGYRKMINDHFYAGFDFNSASFSDYKPRQTYYTESGAYTTDFFKYVYSYGITFNADYYFTPDRKLVPFAGLGIGAIYNTYKEFYNIYAITENNWGLLLRPEIGALLKLTRDGKFGLTGTVHYDFSTSKSTEFNYSNFNSVGFRLGIIVALVN